MYKYYNANPVALLTNDCVLRSISLFEGDSWDNTYNKLSDLAQNEGKLLDDVSFVENYLNSKYRRLKHRARTVGELIEEYPDKRLIVTMNGHIATILYGTLYDTFDCRNRELWGVWTYE